MRPPLPPLHFLVLGFLLLTLLAIMQFGLISLGFQKLGLSAHSATLLLLTSLLGAGINLPLGSVRAKAPETQTPLPPLPWGLPRLPFTGQTRIAVNVGGGLVPLCFSVYLLRQNPLPIASVLLATSIVAAVSYRMSRPIPGLGIGMPIFVAPLTAAIVGLVLGGEHAPMVAYIAGTLGVLIGADLLRLPEVRKLGAPFASIGGAGTFDGIFMTGLIAVLLT